LSTECLAFGHVDLRGDDLVLLPGAPIILKAKLSKAYAFFENTLSNKTVEFYHEGSLLGTSQTDRRGESTFSVSEALPNGQHEIVLRTKIDKKNYESEVLIQILDSTSAIGLLDIDDTISRTDKSELMRGDYKASPPLPGAVAALSELSESFQLLYLTARDDNFKNSTRSWLECFKFVPAPVFVDSWKVGFSGIKFPNARAYKSKKIASIMNTHPNIAFGVGDKESDALAYDDHSILPIIISDRSSTGASSKFPEATIFVTKWKEALRVIKKGHRN